MRNTPTLTLRNRQRISLPPRAVTRANLHSSAALLREMSSGPVVVNLPDPKMQARVAELEAALATAEAKAAALALGGNTALERAQREERVKAITKRIVDRRADWYAKQPKARTPQIVLGSQRIVTADVWQQPTAED